MKRAKTTFIPVVLLFALAAALTNFCVAALFYPAAARASEPTVINHSGCGELPELPAAKVKIFPAAASGNILPCCVGQNNNNDLTTFSVEKPLALSALPLISNRHSSLRNFTFSRLTANLWPPPEKSIIDSTIIRV